jgi:hypothetical protein
MYEPAKDENEKRDVDVVKLLVSTRNASLTSASAPAAAPSKISINIFSLFSSAVSRSQMNNADIRRRFTKKVYDAINSDRRVRRHVCHFYQRTSTHISFKFNL